MDKDLNSFLESHSIEYKKFEHQAVFTCEDVAKIDIEIPGALNKNLFLSDGKMIRYFLVTVEAGEKVNLKQLAKDLSVKDLRFGSAEELKSFLKIEPGSVSILALMHDLHSKVEVIVDEVLWEDGHIQAHPLVNTATLVIPRDSVKKFLEATGHGAFTIKNIPAR